MKDKNGEHPFGDAGQLILLGLFLAVWIGDSFFLHLSTFLSVHIPLIVRLAVLVLTIAIALYLFKSGHVVVSHEHRPEGVVSSGAFSYVRHPLYLGGILFYLGLTFATSSLMSLALLGIGFVFYNYIAGYEERLLEEKLGESYVDYKKNTGKWIPTKLFKTSLNIFIVITCTACIPGCDKNSGDSSSELSAHHPFESAKAKERYLKMYDMSEKEWLVISESRMIDTSYGKTFVRISGPETAQPLVLLPGANATSLMWKPNIEALSEFYRTYAVDNIHDFGRSVSTKAIENPDDFVNWLDELFSALELGDSINLLGLSYGGWLTSQYALSFPERLEKIVLIAPAATVLPFQSGFIFRAVLCIVPLRYTTKNMIFWIAEDMVNKDEASRMRVEEWVDEIMMGRRCFKSIRMINPTVLSNEELRSIRIPTLYMVGENEKIYSAQEAVTRLDSVAPWIETEVIPDAGHDLTILQPEMVNRKILGFLQQR
jgi:pimeloyl-ACP methyl ester carboxylesterase/protein-S-isoprenylcysteine O-methyltransferase Ste14